VEATSLGSTAILNHGALGIFVLLFIWLGAWLLARRAGTDLDSQCTEEREESEELEIHGEGSKSCCSFQPAAF